jgi:glycosyltransferase involved in cell wall biosynthesis
VSRVNWIAGPALPLNADVPSLSAAGPLAAAAAPPEPDALPAAEYPSVSVIVPVKNSGATIRQCVDALQRQNYPGELEVLLVGSIDDPTWQALEGMDGPRDVRLIEADIHVENRDANAKRCVGLQEATGDLLALTDSDMILPDGWVAAGVELLHEGATATEPYQLVAGSMRSTDTGFWAGYVDKNVIGTKTPRMDRSYLVTSGNYGKVKPFTTANLMLQRDVYAKVGGPDPNFTYSYEDYVWAFEIADAGYNALCTTALVGEHHHRQGVFDLGKEYYKSGFGCADLMLKHPDSRLSIRRRAHLRRFAAVAFLGVCGLAASPKLLLKSVASAAALVCLVNGARARSAVATVYPPMTLLLGSAFTLGALNRLLERRLLRGMHETEIRLVREVNPPRTARPAPPAGGSSEPATIPPPRAKVARTPERSWLAPGASPVAADDRP